MSIKKDIVKLINSESDTVKLNDISYLKRYRKDYLGNDVDVLQIVFRYVIGIKGGKYYDISARDYDGVVAEIDKLTHEYLAECADEAVKNIANGYR